MTKGFSMLIKSLLCRDTGLVQNIYNRVHIAINVYRTKGVYTKQKPSKKPKSQTQNRSANPHQERGGANEYYPRPLYIKLLFSKWGGGIYISTCIFFPASLILFYDISPMCDDELYDFWEADDTTEAYSEATMGANSPLPNRSVFPEKHEKENNDLPPAPWAKTPKPVVSRRSMHFVNHNPRI